MAVDPRDQIWEATYETYYVSFYEEVAAEALIARWQWVDEVSKLIVAITASGSAISGWALWNDPTYKLFWVALSGLGALLAIAHMTLAVPRRLKDWGDIKQFFLGLRIDLETLCYRMRINPEFGVEQFTQELVELRKRYGVGCQMLRDDILLTDRLKESAQSNLNQRLGVEATAAEGG